MSDNQEPEITSTAAASAAVAAYSPEAQYGLTPRKVRWTQLGALGDELNRHVLSVLAELANDSDEADLSSLGPALSGAIGFANKLLCLTYGLTQEELDKLDLAWDEGARLLLYAIQVNFRDLQGVVDFFNAALPGLLPVSKSSGSAPPNGPDGGDSA